MAIRAILLLGLVLAPLAGKAEEAAPEFTLQDILDGISSDDTQDRWMAAIRTTKMGADARTAVPHLIVAIGDRESDTRMQVAEALGAIGPDAAAAVDALIGALADEVAENRGAAATALGRIGVKTRPVVDGILKALGDEDPIVRASAVESVVLLELPAETVLAPLLARIVSESNSRVRGLALRAVGRLGVDSTEVRSVVLRVATIEDLAVRSGVVYCLGSIGPRETVLEVLLQALATPSIDIRIEACRSLAVRGPRTPAVTAALIARLDDSETRAQVKVAASLTLYRLGFTERDLVGPLAGWAAEHPDPKVRFRAMQALAEFGTLARAALPAITGRLGDEYALLRTEAARVLIQVGSEPGPARAGLEANLTDRYVLVRVAAARALALLGIEVPRSVAILRRQAATGDVATREAAVSALGEIGPAAAAALPHLDGAIKGEVHAVRVAAATAAARIRKRD